MTATPPITHQGTPPRRVAVIAYTEYAWDPRVRRECEALLADDHVVHVIALRPASGKSPVHLDGVHLHEVPLSVRRGGKGRYLFQYLLFFVLASAKLLRLHLARPFDFVHVHSLPDFLVFAALPLRIRRIPVLLDLHEAMPEILAARMRLPSSSLLVRWAGILEGISAKVANHVIVANDGIRSVIVGRGVPDWKVTTVYNPGDGASRGTRAEVVRARFELPDGSLVVYAGGINEERDLETLLRAVAMLPASEVRCLVVAGDGDPAYLDRLKTITVGLALSDRVRYVGRVSLTDAQDLMSLSAIGVVTLEANPLTELSWPTRIAEFAHIGKPLVVPRLRFIRQVLGDSARYYTPGDAASLASEIRHAVSPAPGQADAIEQAELISRRFASSEMRQRLMDVFRGLEGSHAG